ncbi:hypothetical protein LshimejAT787_2000460 [Lyophyllum shimeji]|uniref:Uncharacterized protein n=1 Tax=Lyophyllum shimeji TaxID=47721 RepID=A0A9P3Q0P8_LYOSH|nr:hypothetical protein LshimejAT787_2000460 [Lyophyllum shimeji]
MYSTRAASGSRPLIPPDSALPPPASVLPPPASVLAPPDSPFLHRRIPDSRFIVAPRAPHITIQFLQGKGSSDLFSLDLPLPASCGAAVLVEEEIEAEVVETETEAVEADTEVAEMEMEMMEAETEAVEAETEVKAQEGMVEEVVPARVVVVGSAQDTSSKLTVLG